MALILGSVSRTLEGSAGPKSQNDNCNEVYQYLSSMLSVNSTLVLHAESLGVFNRFDLESQTKPRNGMDFEILIDFFESHGYPHNFLLLVEIWSNSLWLSIRN